MYVADPPKHNTIDPHGMTRIPSSAKPATKKSSAPGCNDPPSSSGFVTQSGAPSPGGFSKAKWLDVGGLTYDGYAAWPRHKKGQYWNPYATCGKEMDGGIVRSQLGDLPMVNPPRARFGKPYNMEPTWMTGPTAPNDLYKAKCAKKIKHPGKLYYVGPNSTKNAGNTDGAYTWVVIGKSKGTPGAKDFVLGPGHFIPQPSKQYRQSKQLDNEDALDLMKSGVELPPWYRRGTHAAEQAIRSYCR